MWPRAGGIRQADTVPDHPAVDVACSVVAVLPVGSVAGGGAEVVDAGSVVVVVDSGAVVGSGSAFVVVDDGSDVVGPGGVVVLVDGHPASPKPMSS